MSHINKSYLKVQFDNFAGKISSVFARKTEIPTKTSQLANDSGYRTRDLITGVKGSAEETYRTGNINITPANIGLDRVNNTADLDKPVSAKQQEALDNYYEQSIGYANQKIADLIGGAPSTLDTLGEIAKAMQENEDVVGALEAAIGKKANVAEFDSHVKDGTKHITAAERAKWDDANTKKHSHDNKSVLDGITSALVGKWNDAVTHISDAVKHITSAERDKWNNGSHNYGTCSTAAGTAAKNVACAGFKLATGAKIEVKWTVTNTAASPTMNVNSTGAKPIYYRGAAIGAGYLAANRTYGFRYNGAQWELVGDINTDTNDKVTQNASNAANADYRVLLSGTADDMTRTEGTQKGADLRYNPFRRTLTAPEINTDAMRLTENVVEYEPEEGYFYRDFIEMKDGILCAHRYDSDYNCDCVTTLYGDRVEISGYYNQLEINETGINFQQDINLMGKYNDWICGIGISLLNNRVMQFVPFGSGKTATYNLGNTSDDNKWTNIYAKNGTIQTSDRTKKEGIKLLDIDKTAEFVMGLKPVSYRMKDGTSGRTHYGLIAQDIEELMERLGMNSLDFAGFIKSPRARLVMEDEYGRPLKEPVWEKVKEEYDYALRYDEFIAPLIKMVQEQQRKLEQLEQEVREMRNGRS